MAEYTDHDGGAGEEVPDLSDSDDDGQWEWTEESSNASIVCLFCDRSLNSISDTLQHCLSEHDVNIPDLVKKFSLDDYGYIKMINYIRSEKCSGESLLQSSNNGVFPWDSDNYMRPVLPDDPLLQIDLEDLCGVEAMVVGQSCGGQAADLLQRAQQAEERALRSEEALARAMEDLHKLK
ncbi:protein arginine N-methyltransferase 3-like isoform X2 [Clupea harengus]|uniref:Protein arginine N-methyltransferase 3-like isoform X2 n=1 Tax=Clupea harengus TaxID=7950 RepID=A0A8M1KKL8_CLUHA|nr:protein arginine N-methyltransferase 3-like isoform X2 [Clupea harengus]